MRKVMMIKINDLASIRGHLCEKSQHEFSRYGELQVEKLILIIDNEINLQIKNKETFGEDI